MFSDDDEPLQPCLLQLHEMEDSFWSAVATRLSRLKAIIADHFNSPCTDLELLGTGAYARAYRVTLRSGKMLVVRIAVPVRNGVKTEAEVATMDAIRARTSIPVPKVHIFCSTRHNPLGAEWIVMDYMPGEPFADCFVQLTYAQKQRTADDIAQVLHTLYSITATHCGSLQADLSLRIDQRAVRYGAPPSDLPSVTSVTSSGRFVVGPANEFAFMEFPDARLAPLERCGPYASERQFVEGLAFIGFSRTPASIEKLVRWPFEKALEVYDAIRPAYSKSAPHECTAPSEPGSEALFHFCHGDLSTSNILLDPSTGGVTAVLDWEVAGFRPAWAAAAAGAWFDDDRQRFVMSSSQDAPEGYAEDTEDDQELRRYFLRAVGELSGELLHHLVHGVELRAVYTALAEESEMEVIEWLEKHEKYGWKQELRGPYPYDSRAWTTEWVMLYERLHAAGEV